MSGDVRLTLQNIECLVDVLLGIESVVVDQYHLAVLVDHVRDSAWYSSEDVPGNGPILPQLIALVAQQSEWKSVPRLELLHTMLGSESVTLRP